jgi:hypothetical protein
VPSGIPGFHAAWFGQSGYPTLCPGQTSRAVVAFYNSGSLGWAIAPYEYAALGTWGPSPGQDQPSILGGDGTRGTPNTRFAGYNRPAAMPAGYIGPGQVASFQFVVKAPSTPGTYRFYLRPLIEGVQWMEDYGVFWQITVLPANPPQRVTVDSGYVTNDFFTAGGITYRYDRNDAYEWSDAAITYQQFQQLISGNDTVDIRYESTSDGISSFNIVADFGSAPPTVRAEVGSVDGGPRRTTSRSLSPRRRPTCLSTTGISAHSSRREPRNVNPQAAHTSHRHRRRRVRSWIAICLAERTATAADRRTT